MPPATSINARIVEALYRDSLVLADEVRACFDRMREEACGDGQSGDDLMRVAVSCEGLRTTTRVMHCLAWLLNHRAYFEGEISEFQLRRHGRLISSYPAGDRGMIELLPPETQAVIEESERLYARIRRLEDVWRAPLPQGESAIERLRRRLAVSVG